jgi:hypothetical protein
VITTNLNKPTSPARHWFDLPVPAAAGIIIFALYLIVGLGWQLRSAQRAAAVPTPGLIILIATQAAVVPTPAPTAAAQVAAMVPENVVPKAIVVYGAPDLTTAIGAVEAGRVFAPVARYGVEWTQVDMDGSGRVFVRTTDLYGVPELVDLQPAPQPQVIYVAAQPAPAVATPEPHYEVTNAAPTLVPQQAAIYDRQVWAQQAAGW